MDGSLKGGVVFSGPSGVGKLSVTRELLKRTDRVELVRSDTTRRRREGEVDGIDYNFVTVDEFRTQILAGRYLEYAEYAGNFYGTPRSSLEKVLAKGKTPLLEIEIQGARQVIEQAPEVVSVFLLPPDYDELVRRLVGRGTEDEESVRRRLSAMKAEILAGDEYNYRVVNHTVEGAVTDLIVIINGQSDPSIDLSVFQRPIPELVPQLYAEVLAG